MAAASASSDAGKKTAGSSDAQLVPMSDAAIGQMQEQLKVSNETRDQLEEKLRAEARAIQ